MEREERWKKIKSLFAAALERDPSQRDAFLENACGQDEELRREVTSLLSAHEKPNDLSEHAWRDRLLNDAARAQSIGPYRLIKKIGEGGMGQVWLAERIDGMPKRTVALKLPLLSIHSTALAERFARERDILAQLTHPNIARLYDAGVTPTGQPFLALEFVEGLALTDYCDQHQLSVHGRLELLLHVLEAVQYAHRNLVVHRDLKPSNILVSPDTHVSLLDFGIAKLLLEGEAKETELTQAGGRVLTPQYASPEQILGQPVTTATDVYSLGVVVCELLCGHRPYRLKRDSRAALEDAILTADPIPPSRATISEAAAQARSISVRKLQRMLAGDLDVIVLKALRKSPQARYATADALAQDIERYLQGEVVLAQPESAWYRTSKFLRRNILAVTSTLAVFVALAAGLGIALWQARIARTQARTSQAVQGFLGDIFRANSIDQADPARGRQTTAAELLDVGARKIDTALEDAPDAKLKVLEMLGQMYDELELNEQAASVDRKRVRLAKQLHGEMDPSVAQALVRLAVALHTSAATEERAHALKEAMGILDHNRDFTSRTRARLLVELGQDALDKDLSKAMQLTEQAVKINQAFPPDRDVVSALIQLGIFQTFHGETESAEQSFQRALTALDEIRPPTNHDRSQIYTYMGQAQRELQKFADAEKSQRLAFQVAQAVGGADHHLTLIAQMDLGWFLFETGRTKEGLELIAGAKEKMLKNRASDPQSVPYALNRYGRALSRFGRLEEGDQVLSQAAENLRKYRAGSGYLATVLDLQAPGLTDMGRYQEARAALDEAATIHSNIHDDPIYVNENLAARSHLLLATGKTAESSTVLDGFFIKDPAPGRMSLTWVRGQLARANVALAGQKAEQAVELATGVRLAVEHSSSRDYFKAYEAEASLTEGKGLLRLHRATGALPLLQRAMALSLELYDPQLSPTLADAQIALADCLMDLRERAQAQTLFAQAKAIHARHKRLGEYVARPLSELERRLSSEAPRAHHG